MPRAALALAVIVVLLGAALLAQAAVLFDGSLTEPMTSVPPRASSSALRGDSGSTAELDAAGSARDSGTPGASAVKPVAAKKAEQARKEALS